MTSALRFALITTLAVVPWVVSAQNKAPAAAQPAKAPARFGIGRPATPAEIAALDIEIGPDGAGLLVGRLPGDAFPFAKDPRAPKTIGSYWPYATTAFDYIRRAMPPDKPGSLSDDEVYRLVAYLLSLNELIPADAVVDAASLPKVKMPARDHFVPDTRGQAKPGPGRPRR